MRRLYSGIVIFLLMDAVVAVKYAEPVSDSDIWFHLAYGRQLVENGTLVPDHAAFSWTRTDPDFIYCAWIPELVFYGLYSLGGMEALYGLRYLVIALFLALAWSLSPRGRGFFDPPVLAVCLTGLLMCYGGLRIKPEIFSFALMALATWVWLRIKEEPDSSWRLAWLFPIIMAIWVNSHGGFIFGAVFLDAVFLGEVLNVLLKSPDRLGGRAMKHLFSSSVLSALALMATPYGWRYPAQLIDSLVLNPAEFRAHQETIAEYQTIFFPQALHLHFIDYLAAASVIVIFLLVLDARRNRPDFALWLGNALFVLIYARYLRTTYFWAVIFVFSACHLFRRLSGDQPPLFERKAFTAGFRVAALAVLVFFSARSVCESLCPRMDSYVYQEEEALYIRDHLPGLVMGNDYYSGAYLLWALHPGHKVLIDARYFPYRKWYLQYDDLENSTDANRTALLLKGWPCDFWCLSYGNPLIGHFSKSADWRLAYYGPSACIYVSGRVPGQDRGHTVSGKIYGVDIIQAYKIAKFADAAGDIDVARRMALAMDPVRFCAPQEGIAVNARLNIGRSLMKLGRHHDAMDLLREALEIYGSDPLLKLSSGGVSVRADVARAHDLLGYCLMKVGRTGEAYRALAEGSGMKADSGYAGTYLQQLREKLESADEAIARLEEALKKSPEDTRILGSLAVLYSVKGDYPGARGYLEKEIALNPGSPAAYYNMACLYSKEGDVDKALGHLETALKKGFSDWDLVRTDPDLEAVRRLPGLRRL
jgi:hypothetical protein